MEQASHYKTRLIEGKCVWGKCGRKLADGSAYCPKHRRRKRTLNSESEQRKRDGRRAVGLCPYCPGDKPTPVVPPETSCLACRVRRRNLSGINIVATRDEVKAARIAAATRKGDDGRVRFHGQQKRGNQPRIQLDDQDIGYARDAIAAGETGLHLYEQALAAKVPVFQRDDIKSAALHQLSRAQDHLDDVLERRGFFKDRSGHILKRHGKRGE